jgi:DNA-directed RNA polymerase subunit RPC12/RpoP
MPVSIDSTSGRAYNLHSVYMHGQPLGVECKGCGHRALAFADKVDQLKGDMTELRTLRFVCQACGSRDWRGWLFIDAGETAAFLATSASPAG